MSEVSRLCLKKQITVLSQIQQATVQLSKLKLKTQLQ